MSIVYTCGDISTPYSSNEHRKALNDRKARNKAQAIASQQVINHTSEGDFTHLAPTGHLTTVYRRV